MKIIYLIFFLAIISQVYNEDDGDLVDAYSLPIGFPAHDFFAGYLNITSTISFYYTYFPSEFNPAKDPLVVRISAGPGCSALYSAFYSKGPFIFVRNTKNFRINPFNWNKQANVLFIEGPAGVGFSRGVDKQYNDDRAALQYYVALLRFYEKFPELRDQPMYLTGQQYAGIIIPRIAQTMIELNRNPDTPAWQKVKLAGLLLNNPCTLRDQCDSNNDFSRHTMRYLKNHYFLSQQQYDNYVGNCTMNTTECQDVKKSIQSHFLTTGSDLNNLYIPCLQQQGDIKCMDLIGITSFLNDKTVKDGMHADPQLTWKMCNFDIRNKWIRDSDGSLKIYEKLLKQQRQLKIWIVSGVLSANIPITGTKMWFEELKHNLGLSTTRMWQPWYYNQTLNAGDIEQISGMSLVTVRGGGYHLWNDQPQIGQHILNSYLKGTPL